MTADGVDDAVDGTDVSGLNLAWWDERAALHGADRCYDEAGFVADGTVTRIRKHDLDAAGDVAGRDLIHLQCHTGMDTLSWLRLGAATVTGLDFSPVAVAKARATAERSGLADRATFVEADVLDVPADLHGRFDVCFANIGAICWVGDLVAWMRSARSVLRPGGLLALNEIHPLYTMAERLDPLTFDFPYENTGGLRFDDDEGSYAVPGAVTTNNATVTWAHSLGEVVTAAVAGGLVVERLVEHTAIETDGRGLLSADDDGMFRWHHGEQLLPVAFSLTARRVDDPRGGTT